MCTIEKDKKNQIVIKTFQRKKTYGFISFQSLVHMGMPYVKMQNCQQHFFMSPLKDCWVTLYFDINIITIEAAHFLYVVAYIFHKMISILKR